MLLDTHAWVWWISESPKLSTKAFQAITQTTAPIGIHPVSCWEVAMLVTKGCIGFNRVVGEWITLALKRANVRLLSCSAE